MSILFSNYLLPAFPNSPLTGPPASTYVGPGDVVGGWLAWWGLRGFSAAVAATGTQKAVNVRRASDSTTTDILILTSGALDVATLSAFQVVDATGTGAITGTALTFTGGHIGDVVTGGTTLPGTVIVSGSSPAWTVNLSQTVVSTTLTLTWGMFVTKFYNQSGTGSTLDVANATAAQQPQIVLAGGPSGGVCVKFVGSSSQSLTTTGSVVTPTGALTFVAQRNGAFTTLAAVTASSTGWNYGFAGAVNKIYSFAGLLDATATATDSVWHASNVTFNGAPGNDVCNVDNNLFTVHHSSGTQNSVVSLGANAGAQFLTGVLVEAGWTSTIFNSTQQTALNNNQHGSNGWNF